MGPELDAEPPEAGDVAVAVDDAPVVVVTPPGLTPPTPTTPTTVGEPGSGISPSTYGFLQLAALGGGGCWPPFSRPMALKSSWTSTGGRGE